MTGAGGQVGRALSRRAGPDWVLLDRAAIDLTDEAAVASAVASHRPEGIVNAAAFTAVDAAEAHPDEAHAVNALGAGHLARAAARHGAALIHLSTDYVFDGSLGRPAREADPPRPRGVYARSKRAGEEAVAAAGGRHLILRTSWVIGPDRPNFVATMVRLLLTRPRLTVVDDQRGGPTPSDEVARAILAALPRLHRGDLGTTVLHAGGEPHTTWHGLALAVRDALGVDVPVDPIPTADWPTAAPRPPDSRLDGARLREVLGLSLGWREALPGIVTAWRRRLSPRGAEEDEA